MAKCCELSYCSLLLDIVPLELEYESRVHCEWCWIISLGSPEPGFVVMGLPSQDDVVLLGFFAN